ncbi:hypothetical protein K1T71_004365 [Dendrolimus kikuchii]|uniref:Uncharacterized protein n=1 Tax=Dendrolimus kikuchii TaxID=765133 RepID=A0ACC1D790_9NEOP|nr:hypothetical protein K1T71_004365 [Dendrolimus kikuchii]
MGHRERCIKKYFSCILAPDVNIESIYEQLAYNTYDEEYNNEQLIENNIVLREIR